MNFQEIVGAMIDSVTITSDMTRIDASRLFGKEVQYITRKDAKKLAARDRSKPWSQLAAGPTLFLSQDHSLFRCQV